MPPHANAPRPRRCLVKGGRSTPTRSGTHPSRTVGAHSRTKATTSTLDFVCHYRGELARCPRTWPTCGLKAPRHLRTRLRPQRIHEHSIRCPLLRPDPTRPGEPDSSSSETTSVPGRPLCSPHSMSPAGRSSAPYTGDIGPSSSRSSSRSSTPRCPPISRSIWCVTTCPPTRPRQSLDGSTHTPVPPALHSNQRVLTQLGRALVRVTDRQAATPRRTQEPSDPGERHQHLDHNLE